jgi:autotransporter strand-loop-strand O-heptosyltransferase
MKKIKRIAIDSPCLGDTIAWMPLIDKYRKVNDYDVEVTSAWNEYFVNAYPKLKFRGNEKFKYDLSICLHYHETMSNYQGEQLKYPAMIPNMEFHKRDWRLISLQDIANDILDLPHEEVQSKVEVPDRPPNIIGKYVCIGTQSTIQSKYWNNPNGWDDVIEYLKGEGYNVVCIDQFRQYGHADSNTWNHVPDGVIDKTESGLDLWDRIIDLKYADFFIGLGSGLSWLSWAVGTHTFMISGFSKPFYEFQSNITRISQDSPDVCSGCFNLDIHPFERDNFNWCPEHIGTEREYECSKKISSDTVIEHIKKWINK